MIDWIMGHTFMKANYNTYYLTSDRSGVHLCKEGQNKLLYIIEEAVTKAAGRIKKKRARSLQETPPSAEKDTKTRKCDK